MFNNEEERFKKCIKVREKGWKSEESVIKSSTKVKWFSVKGKNM